MLSPGGVEFGRVVRLIIGPVKGPGWRPCGARLGYPPKYVVSLAAADATGRELRPNEFSGGDETNSVLQSLGFTIVGPGLPASRPGGTKPSSGPPRTTKSAAPPPAKTPASGVQRGLHPIVRVVVQGEPASSSRAAGDMLLEAFENWPVPGRAKFTITPGGFVVGDFPSRWSGGIAWDSSSDDLDALVRVVQPVVFACVTKKVLAAGRARTRVLTIGVDLMSDAEHAELVAVIDCDSGEIVRWTGKSYPTGNQEALLVQVSDVSTHLYENRWTVVIGRIPVSPAKHDPALTSGGFTPDATGRQEDCNIAAPAQSRRAVLPSSAVARRLTRHAMTRLEFPWPRSCKGHRRNGRV